MHRYGSRPRVTTTTTTTEDSASPSSERRVLRLTLLAGNDGKKEEKTADTAEAENHIKETWKKKNGLIHRERPAGMESPQRVDTTKATVTQHLRDTTNGAPATSTQHHGPKVYGVVQRTSPDRRQELMAREWSVDHLHDEMRYIREVRDSLEKVRERMYGQFGGMQQSMEKLSREIRAANAHRKTLESEVKVRTSAMENFDQMNSSLISANISLQKSLLENCQNRVDMKDEVKTLRSTYEKTQEKLRDKEQELAAAQAENQTLRLQVESSREANTRAVQDLTAKLQREYEEKLQSEQQKHREEIENLQAQLDEYIRRLEEAERNLRTAEAKIAERDERIVEVERLLSCMGMEKSHLQQKLQECEQRIRLLELTDKTDAAAAKKSKQLQEEAVELRERIKHLNDMVFCQQRKVKGMIEEVESLRAQVAQKDMFISELLDRIAIVECENNELEDKLKYFMSTQNRPQEILERRDVGVGCDLLPRHEVQRHDVESVHLHSTPPTSPVQPSSPVNTPSPTQPLSPTEPSSPTPWAPSSSRPSYLSSLQFPSFRLTTPIQPRTYSSTNPPPSRLETSLLKYSPGQYSQYLQSSKPAMNGVSSESDPVESPVPSSRDEVDAEPKTDTATQTKPQVTSSTSSSRPRSRLQVSSPFMKLIGHNLKDEH